LLAPPYSTPVQTIRIQACNCIYHDLAQQHNEMSPFGWAVIAFLLNEEMERNAIG